MGAWLLQITARDEQGALAPHGMKQQGNQLIPGPPATLGDTGVDHVAFVQAALNRDTTHAVNGSPVGARDAFLVRCNLDSMVHLPLRMHARLAVKQEQHQQDALACTCWTGN